MDYSIESDPDTGLSFVEAGGEKRLLACLPRKEDSGLPRFAAAPSVRVIPRSEWKDKELTHFFDGIDDQNGHGACAGFAAEVGAHVSKNLHGGIRRKFSPWFNYAMVNGGQDQGAIVSDLMKSMRDIGLALDETVPDKAWHKRMIPKEAYEDAKRFRLHQAYELSTFDEVVSAVLQNFPVVFGVMIGNRFSPDGEGVVPNWDGANVGGHAMPAIGVKFVRNQCRLVVPNSWSERWGLRGFCYMNESYFRGQRWGLDAFAVQTMASDPEEASVAVA